MIAQKRSPEDKYKEYAALGRTIGQMKTLAGAIGDVDWFDYLVRLERVENESVFA